jgi:hypothetical protein
MNFKKALFLSISLVVLGLSLPAQAVDVILDSDRIDLPSGDVRLIRTAATPKKVKLTVPVEMGRRFCAVMGTRVVDGYNGAQCGWDRELRYECYRERVCRPGPGGRPYCTIVTRCFNHWITFARYCTWEIPECERYDIETRLESRELNLKFKRMARLEDGQTEVYELVGKQNRIDGKEAVFNLKAIDVKQPVKIVERDGLFTLFRDVAVIKGK